ncbi:hypothetical protein Tco_0075168, partial [Tanacetum coccineum]
KKFTSGKLNCGYQWRPTGKKFALGVLCPLTKLSVQCRTGHPLVSGREENQEVEFDLRPSEWLGTTLLILSWYTEGYEGYEDAIVIVT